MIMLLLLLKGEGEARMWTPPDTTLSGDGHEHRAGNVSQTTALQDEAVHPVDRAVWESRSPRVAVQATRYGHGAGAVLWIKASESGWVLLPHGMPTLAVHLSTNEFTTMLNGLRDKL